MRLRKLATLTQSGYIRAVRYFAGWLHRSPDTACAEDLRRYQLHCVDRCISPIAHNATITGLTFLFVVTLGRPHSCPAPRWVAASLKSPVHFGLFCPE